MRRDDAFKTVRNDELLRIWRIARGKSFEFSRQYGKKCRQSKEVGRPSAAQKDKVAAAFGRRHLVFPSFGTPLTVIFGIFTVVAVIFPVSKPIKNLDFLAVRDPYCIHEIVSFFHCQITSANPLKRHFGEAEKGPKTTHLVEFLQVF